MKCKRSMDTAIIKFYSLANPVWSASKYNYLFFIRWLYFILGFISVIIIRGVSIKFCGTCIHCFKGYANVKLFPEIYNTVFTAPAQIGDLDIGIPQPFCFI